MRFIKRDAWLRLPSLAAGLLVAGCVITVEPIDTQPSTPTTITIRIVNNTNKALDPQIYVAPREVGAANIFQPQYLKTDFGLGNRGILAPRSDAVFTITCADQGLVGTQGGIYGDDLNNPIDQGRQVVLESGVSMQCGDYVQFRFDALLSELITTYSVTPGGG